MAVALIGVRRVWSFADANRAGKGAMPFVGFSGLPGDTSHQNSSRHSESVANRLIARWPPCAGLNDPPMRPMVFKGGFARFRAQPIYRS